MSTTLLISESHQAQENEEEIAKKAFDQAINKKVKSFHSLFMGNARQDTKMRAELLELIKVTSGSTPEKARNIVNIFDCVIQEVLVKNLRDIKEARDKEAVINEKIEKDAVWQGNMNRKQTTGK